MVEQRDDYGAWGRRQADRDVAVQVAIMSNQLADLMKHMENLNGKVDDMEEAMQRSKGAIKMLMVIGSIATATAGAWIWIIQKVAELGKHT